MRTVYLSAIAQLLVVVLNLLISNFSFASQADSKDVSQDASKESLQNRAVVVPAFWSMITDLPADFKELARESTTSEGLKIVSGITLITAIGVASDYESWQAARIPFAESHRVHKLANYGVSIGDGYFQFGIVGAFAAAGGLLGNNLYLRTASQITESILSTGIVVQVIKHLSGRESPFSSESRTGKWRVFPNQLAYLRDVQKFDAMPSGHLSTAVTTLVVIQENFPDQKWIPFVGWPTMGLVAFGLAGTSIHWWSDYPIAVALGYSFARIVTRENRGLEPVGSTRGESNWKPWIFPSMASDGEPIMNAAWSF
jgi:hypothetical protein